MFISLNLYFVEGDSKLLIHTIVCVRTGLCDIISSLETSHGPVYNLYKCDVDFLRTWETLCSFNIYRLRLLRIFFELSNETFCDKTIRPNYNSKSIIFICLKTCLEGTLQKEFPSRKVPQI